MKNVANKANLPAWEFKNSYGTLTSSAFRKERQRLEANLHLLNGLVPNAKDAVSVEMALGLLRETACLLDSLIGYCRCLSALDSREQEPGKESTKIWKLHARYYSMLCEVFRYLDELKESDPLWKEFDFRPWESYAKRIAGRWNFALSPASSAMYYGLRESNFIPCQELYRSLNAHLVAKVRTMDGLTKNQSHSQCIAVLKTSEDPILRQTTFSALNEYYAQHAYIYASIFNMLAGFRLEGFKASGCGFMAPAYWQNYLSEAAAETMLSTVRSKLEMLRKSVTLRAFYEKKAALDVWDLNAPAPVKRAENVPYGTALDKIKEAGKILDEEIPSLFEEFVGRGWVEARQIPGKQYGAFFQGICSLNEPRIFSTYLGTFASMSQQAIMFGHAWHFWLMRELPYEQRKTSRAMMEVAGHFFALRLFEHIQETSVEPQERLQARWQELTFISNYILNMGVRFEFEKSFYEERQNGSVSLSAISHLLSKAWEEWYGVSTNGTDPYLWINRGQFYKIDDYFYHYPYIFGILCAYGLSEIRKGIPEIFPSIYQSFLKESGSMSADELFRKYFKVNLAQPEFWEQCLEAIAGKIVLFEKEVRAAQEAESV